MSKPVGRMGEAEEAERDNEATTENSGKTKLARKKETWDGARQDPQTNVQVSCICCDTFLSGLSVPEANLAQTPAPSICWGKLFTDLVSTAGNHWKLRFIHDQSWHRGEDRGRACLARTSYIGLCFGIGGPRPGGIFCQERLAEFPDNI